MNTILKTIFETAIKAKRREIQKYNDNPIIKETLNHELNQIEEYRNHPLIKQLEAQTPLEKKKGA